MTLHLQPSHCCCADDRSSNHTAHSKGSEGSQKADETAEDDEAQDPQPQYSGGSGHRSKGKSKGGRKSKKRGKR